MKLRSMNVRTTDVPMEILKPVGYVSQHFSKCLKTVTSIACKTMLNSNIVKLIRIHLIHFERIRVRYMYQVHLHRITYAKQTLHSGTV